MAPPGSFSGCPTGLPDTQLKCGWLWLGPIRAAAAVAGGAVGQRDTGRGLSEWVSRRRVNNWSVQFFGKPQQQSFIDSFILCALECWKGNCWQASTCSFIGHEANAGGCTFSQRLIEVFGPFWIITLNWTDGDCGVTLCYYYTCIGIADARAAEASIRKWVVEECYKKRRWSGRKTRIVSAGMMMIIINTLLWDRPSGCTFNGI